MAIQAFCEKALENKWKPVLLPGPQDGTRDKDYKIRGIQWIWFLVREPWFDRCGLQSPEVWESFTGQKTWQVYYWGKTTPKRHDHCRHPQVLRVDIDGEVSNSLTYT